MLECVVNVSEGRRTGVIDALAEAGGPSLLDVHSDPDHHRSVLTLAGPAVEAAARDVAAEAVRLIDLRLHEGAHPRMGAVDVVPFVALDEDPGRAVVARDRFAAWAARALGLPCFLYGPLTPACLLDGPARSLPEVRRAAFSALAPDTGPPRPHPTAGATAVGARGPLVAYNLWLASDDVAVAREAAGVVRSVFAGRAAGGTAAVRALGLEVAGTAQVSCNLLDPVTVGPDQVYDAVAARADIGRAELVGLAPAAVLGSIPEQRWEQLDLATDRTIEHRLARSSAGPAGPRGGSVPRGRPG